MNIGIDWGNLFAFGKRDFPNVLSEQFYEILCVLQMCSNVRWAVRDFALNILSLEGEWNFVLGLRTTLRFMQLGN